jgi:hypothetical protein
MPFAPLYELLPEVANTETRNIKVLDGDGLPRGTYIFSEMFCNDERCDCRRAFIQVLPDGNQPCPCGSGTKYKRCCWGKDSAVGVKRA